MMHPALAGDLTDLLARPAWRQRAALIAREVSVLELVTATLDRIDHIDARMRSFVHVAHAAAAARARQLDSELAGGARPGPLFGVAVSVKDLFHVAGMPTTAGSLLFRDAVAEDDSVHAARLRLAGAVIVGKTNTPEFGVFPRTVNRLQPETLNPWDLERTPGGSSGGAGASVAAGLTPIAVGSDGGGSIRIPAALCGVAGMLPSRGLVPRHGGVGGTLLFSSAGPVAADIRDLASLLQVLAGPLDADPLAWTSPVPDFASELDRGVAGKRIRWLGSTGVAPVDPRVASVAEAAARSFEAGAAIMDETPVELDATPWQEGFYAIMNADRYATVGQRIYEDYATRALLSEYGEAAFARGRGVSGAQYSRALELRYAARRDLRQLFETTDLLLSPTTCVIAPRTSEEVRREPLIAFTNFCNLAGLPAATVPCGQVDGLPVGLHVVGRPGDDALVLRASRAFERLHPIVRPDVGRLVRS